jgi:putative protein-disulfide isomerase
MPVHVHYFTDPACSASWAAEPIVRRLMVEFDSDLSFHPVMGGLARDYERGHEMDYRGLLLHWLDRAADSGMPLDARLWSESPIRTTYPACMAVKAASEQGPEAEWRYLRALREGLLCFRRKLDTTEALVEEARGAGLDAARFRIDLGSHAIVEAFGADLELTRAVPDAARSRDGVVQGQGGERVPFPTGRFGDDQWVFGLRPYEEWREAALAAGAQMTGEAPPDVLAALRRFGRMAAPEVAAVCDLAGPRAEAELWRLAADWKVKATRVLTGHLFELA